MTNPPLSLLELSPDACRWPVADDPVFFCGEPTEADCPYCLRHRALAYIRA